jgi:hypothetical protein
MAVSFLPVERPISNAVGNLSLSEVIAKLLTALLI